MKPANKQTKFHDLKCHILADMPISHSLAGAVTRHVSVSELAHIVVSLRQEPSI